MSNRAKIERYKQSIARNVDSRDIVKAWAFSSIIATIAAALGWHWLIWLISAAVLIIFNAVADRSIENQTKQLWQLDKKAVLSIARNIGVTKLADQGVLREEILDEMIKEDSR